MTSTSSALLHHHARSPTMAIEKGFTNESLPTGEKDTHLEGSTSPEPRPTRGQKIKRHLKRWWWIYLIALLLSIMIIVLCIVYVHMPRRAQKEVDHSSLNITEMQYLDPTGDSIVLSQRAVLRNPGRYTPTLDPFEVDFILVTDGVDAPEAVLRVPIPKVHATKPTREIVIENANISFVSLEQATRYTMAVLGSEEVTVALRGDTKLRLGGLPTVNVDYDEVVTFKGLNRLDGFNVTNMLINPEATSGPNMQGVAVVPNPSILTLALGNVSLAITSGAMMIGNATIPNLTLRPGDNRFPMIGTLNTTLILGTLDRLEDGMLDVNITGQEAVYNGQHLTYYETALSKSPLPLSINVTQVLADSRAAAARANATSA